MNRVAVFGSLFLLTVVYVLFMGAAHPSIQQTQLRGHKAKGLHSVNEALARQHARAERIFDKAQKRVGTHLVRKTADPLKAAALKKAHDQMELEAEEANTSVPPQREGNPQDDTIFVSISSFRDEVCHETVTDIFKKANHPQRVFLGIVQQHAPEDIPCVAKEMEVGPFAKNIRVKKYLPHEARGPTFGRFQAWTMYNGEKYFMMLDSHNTFVTHWDTTILYIYRNLVPSKKGVLSHYPEGWERSNPKFQSIMDRKTTTTYMCTAKFVEGLGYLRFDGFVFNTALRPRPQPWAAGGFLFASAELPKEVPFDPHLDYIFDGEEIAYAARMYTHGWDVFSPNRNILFHYYYRPKSKKYGHGSAPAKWDERKHQSEKRVQLLLKAVKKGTDERLVPDDYNDTVVTQEIAKYGLGTERTLDQYWKWAGVDPKAYTIDKMKFCKHAKWSPPPKDLIPGPV
jgi:hypothetical protein